MEQARVFLIEDDESLRKIMMHFLKREGFKLIGTAAAADEGLKIMQRLLSDIDVVIVDAQMPESRKAITTIVDNVPRIAVVVLTGSIPKAANQIANVTYFEQPFVPETLTTLIRQSIEQKRANDGPKFGLPQAPGKN